MLSAIREDIRIVAMHMCNQINEYANNTYHVSVHIDNSLAHYENIRSDNKLGPT